MDARYRLSAQIKKKYTFLCLFLFVFFNIAAMKQDTHLEFEQLICTLEEKLRSMEETAATTGVDIKDAVKILKKRIKDLTIETFSQLTPWQRVQLSRHPNRPYTLDYIHEISSSFVELHGDRQFGDDKAIIGGLAKIDNRTIMVIGQQKGRNTKQRQYRNFGMSNPEGYRKALRLMKLAEKFQKPILTLIDTPGAYPGIEAEARGQAQAIALNMFEMFQLKVPIICIIIGEGASGGAIALATGDKVFMMENTWYSVISPESCSSILWRSWEYKEQAAEALKLTAQDMHTNGLIDGIIKEPLGGAHRNWKEAGDRLKKQLIKTLQPLDKMSTEALLQNRRAKFAKMGQFQLLKPKKDAHNSQKTFK